MQDHITDIVVLGGGTAGWITAGLLAASDRKLTVTLIESPDIPIIGVGEGTWPSMRATLQKIGLPETTLFKKCDASYKQGTRFFDWSKPGESYIHPFSMPAEYASFNMAENWQLDSAGSSSFADYVTPQAAVIMSGKAPKQATTPEYAFNVNYGYHFDAGLIASELQAHIVNTLDVRYVSANLTAVISANDGSIEGLKISDGSTICGDLFVDCSGQRSLLLGEHYGVKLTPVSDILFNDRAIVVQVPYSETNAAINSVTHSTASEAGWIWDIGLQTRRGVGYVHSSSHADEDAALSTLQAYVAATSSTLDPDSLRYRTINFSSGYREQFWVKNCVAIGLSAGFIEPLEASALALIEQFATMLGQQLPVTREMIPPIARKFNDKQQYHWQRIIEFLKLHYVLSSRQDTPYWNDCREPKSCPESLLDKMQIWDQQAPWHDDAPRLDELFPSASYQYVLYGMGHRASHLRQRSRPDLAQKLARSVEEKRQQLLALLPDNRELLMSTQAVAEVG